MRDGGALLSGAVASVLQQCGPEDEVLVIDDGSHDGAVAALAADLRLRIHRLGPHETGIVAALEAGRARARGRFLLRLDADDQALPGRLSAQVQALEADPALAVVGGRAQLEGLGGQAPGSGMQRYVDWINGLREPMRERFVESPLFHPGVAMRAAALHAVGGYRDGDFPEDYELWLRFVAQGWQLGALTREVVLLRDHGQRLTRTDARYRREAFDRLKWRHLMAEHLVGKRSLALWAGRRGAKPYLPWALEAGLPLRAWIDLLPGPPRRGLPVLRPEALAELEVEGLLVAVGSPRAREEIRQWIAQLRPEWREGEDWWALR